MGKARLLARLAGVTAALAMASCAHATYWTVFNVEGESSTSASIVTFASLSDMLNGTNYTGVYNPSAGGLFGRNVVDSDSNGSTYWSVFNIEGDSSAGASIVTFASLSDMLNGTHYTGVYNPSAGGLFGQNVVGSGTDGSTYWLVFNIEGESSTSASIVTFASLSDMLNGTNYTGVYNPSAGGLFGRNVVDSGSNGSTYWLLFNVEGESSNNASIVSFASLSDMLNGTHYTGLYDTSAGGLFGRNIVGSGSDSFPLSPPPSSAVPEPTTWAMMMLGFGGIGYSIRKRLR